MYVTCLLVDLLVVRFHDIALLQPEDVIYLWLTNFDLLGSASSSFVALSSATFVYLHRICPCSILP